MNMRSTFPAIIAGQGGGGKRARGGGGGTEAPNSLKSKQIARIIDLLSEGPIVGPVDGAKSIYFDGVPVENDDGSANFSNWSIAGNSGWPAQPILSGFAAQQAETSVNLQVKTTLPITRTILNGDVDRCRITVSVPALQRQEKDGDIKGTNLIFEIWLQSNGGGYQLVTRHEISGKTNTRYQRALTFNLVGDPPWDVRIVRITADSTKLDLQNDLYWDSYTEIIDSRVNYTLSAVIGVTIDAEQFQSIPKRTYDIKGLLVQVPTNYNPDTRVYTGTWNGTFKQAWTDNPAWVFYDLVTQSRYGLGDFVKAADVDKWTLYKVAQWCDQLVPNGRGGSEPRFTCNAVISSQQEAFDLLASMASVFRGVVYWAGGQMVAVADQPSDPVALYTNANVVDGAFSYHGGDIRARHNMYTVRWNDPENLGEPRPVIVEDPLSISKLGIQREEIEAIGCTSEAQAIRVGKWALYTDNYEAETVDFIAGLEAAWARPGDIVRIADVNIGGERRGGRLVAATTTQLTLDAPVNIVAGRAYYASVVLPDGTIATSQATAAPGNQTVLGVSFATAPLPDTVFVIASSDLQPTLWRVITARQSEKDRYEMSAVRHLPEKWAYVEKNVPLPKVDISNIGGVPGISNVNAKDYLIALSPISIGVRMLISWQSTAPAFEIAWRPKNGNWTRQRVDQTAHDVEVQEGDYEIWVTPISMIGRKGATTKINYTVIGRSAPPADVANFRIQVKGDIALFQWAPSTELDVMIGGAYEIRHSSRTTSGVSWVNSNKVLTSIPGTATSVELPYRPGTYLIKALDISGIYSSNASMVVTTLATPAIKQFIRISESPNWLGAKSNTEIRLPQEWLIITDENAGSGVYTFNNRIDMGGIFPVTLTVDMLAFPFYESDIFIDERTGLVDDYQNFDSTFDDGDGMVSIRVRQTNDDPASPSAVWSDWAQFMSGEYTGRGFQFQAWLDAPDGQNVAVEELHIIADVSAKMEQGADVAWVPNKMRINFAVKFQYTPSISVAIQQGVTGDYFVITNKSRTGFDLELKNASNAIITAARTFDWAAHGF